MALLSIEPVPPRLGKGEIVAILRLEIGLLGGIGEKVLPVEHHHHRALGRHPVVVILPVRGCLPHGWHDVGLIESWDGELPAIQVVVDRDDVAVLDEAALDDAILTGTRLETVDLTSVTGLTATQIATARTDSTTRFPPYLSHSRPDVSRH